MPAPFETRTWSLFTAEYDRGNQGQVGQVIAWCLPGDGAGFDTIVYTHMNGCDLVNFDGPLPRLVMFLTTVTDRPNP